MSEPTRSVERCLPIAAPRAEVFRALLDPAALSRWMYATVQWKPQTGAAYRIDWKDTNLPAQAQGEILEIQDNRRLVLSWFMEKDGRETTASFDLDDDDSGGTVLRFRHAGLPDGADWKGRFDMVSLEWDKVLENLRFLVEEGGLDKTAFYLREQIDLPASRERVYAHWVGPAALASWLAKSAFVDPAPGGEIDLELYDGRRARGTFRIFVPGKHLRLVLEEDGSQSLLGISFWPAAEGSTMTLTHRSYAIDESRRTAVREAWREAFSRLRSTLERRPGRWPRSGPRSIEIERTVPAPPDRVWKAIADPAGLSSWFCDKAELTARAGHPYALLWTGWGEQRGEILDVEPNERLAMSWDIPSAEATTLVEFRISPADRDPNRSRVSLVHSEWGEGEAWDAERSATSAGWRSVLALLEFYLATARRGARRSFLIRRRLGLSVPALWRSLSTPDGLASCMGGKVAIDPREGGAISGILGDGQAIRGRVGMAEPAEGLALALESPEPAYVDIGWAASGDASRVTVSGITYGAAETWPQQQRVLWDERLGRLGAKGG